MSKHVTYGKTFGRFYEAYRMFCRDNSETGKPTAETPAMFQDWFYANVAMSMDDATATDPEINEITKLALNLISYIYCFPECLVDGAPHDIKTQNNHYLNTSEKEVEAGERAENGVVIPHFRRGYFKRLSSDFYKNKKGQIVFVHETIVNGVAKTLE